MACKPIKPKVVNIPENVVRVLKLMANPTRYRILYLLKNKEKKHCEIVGMTGRAQPTVAIHLKVLLKNNIIKKTVRNNNVYYSLHPKIRMIMNCLELHLKKFKVSS